MIKYVYNMIKIIFIFVIYPKYLQSSLNWEAVNCNLIFICRSYSNPYLVLTKLAKQGLSVRRSIILDGI